MLVFDYEIPSQTLTENLMELRLLMETISAPELSLPSDTDFCKALKTIEKFHMDYSFAMMDSDPNSSTKALSHVQAAQIVHRAANLVCCTQGTTTSRFHNFLEELRKRFPDTPGSAVALETRFLEWFDANAKSPK